MAAREGLRKTGCAPLTPTQDDPWPERSERKLGDWACPLLAWGLLGQRGACKTRHRAIEGNTIEEKKQKDTNVKLEFNRI